MAKWQELAGIILLLAAFSTIYYGTKYDSLDLWVTLDAAIPIILGTFLLSKHNFLRFC